MNGNAPPTYLRLKDCFTYFRSISEALFNAFVVGALAAAMSQIVPDSWLQHHKDLKELIYFNQFFNQYFTHPIIPAFLVTFPLVLIYLMGPDQNIHRRLRQVGIKYRLTFLTPVSDPAWNRFRPRFPFLSEDVLVAMKGWCWTLAPAGDSSRSLVVSHLPKADVVVLPGFVEPEYLCVIYFCYGGDAQADFPQSTRERLGEMGYQIAQYEQGTAVYRIDHCAWWNALDVITVDNISELWRLCAAKTALTAAASSLSS